MAKIIPFTPRGQKPVVEEQSDNKEPIVESIIEPFIERIKRGDLRGAMKVACDNCRNVFNVPVIGKCPFCKAGSEHIKVLITHELDYKRV